MRKIIKKIKNWFANRKHKKLIYDEIRSSVFNRNDRPIPPKRFKKMANRIHRGVKVHNKLENDEKTAIKEYNDEIYLRDLKRFIDKHYLNENAEIKSENQSLKSKLHNRDLKIKELERRIVELKQY